MLRNGGDGATLHPHTLIHEMFGAAMTIASVCRLAGDCVSHPLFCFFDASLGASDCIRSFPSCVPVKSAYCRVSSTYWYVLQVMLPENGSQRQNINGEHSWTQSDLYDSISVLKESESCSISKIPAIEEQYPGCPCCAVG